MDVGCVAAVCVVHVPGPLMPGFITCWGPGLLRSSRSLHALWTVSGLKKDLTKHYCPLDHPKSTRGSRKVAVVHGGS